MFIVPPEQILLRFNALKPVAETTLLLAAFISLLLVSGCDSKIIGGYKPPMIPVKLTIDSSGNLSIEGEKSLVTPIGVFSIGAEYELKKTEDSLVVILRDRRKGFDNIYRVRSGGDEFTAVLDGKTSIKVVNHQITIDITGGDVKSVEFKRASGEANASSTPDSNSVNLSPIQNSNLSIAGSFWGRTWPDGNTERFTYTLYCKETSANVNMTPEWISYGEDPGFFANPPYISLIRVAYRFPQDSGDAWVREQLLNGAYLVDEFGSVRNFVRDTGEYNSDGRARRIRELRPKETWTTEWQFHVYNYGDEKKQPRKLTLFDHNKRKCLEIERH